MSPLQRLSPGQRRLLSAAVAIGGVVLVGGSLRGQVPRTVELHLPLRSLVRAGYTPQSVTVVIARGGETLRSFERRFGRMAPMEVVDTLDLPEGPLRAHVEVTLEDRVLVRDAIVEVRAGERLDLPCPRVPAEQTVESGL